jgi:Rrf2 family protein
MFTFTKKADYALLALSFLATEGVGRIVGPREIARRYDIPAELLAKVMQTLAKRQIVVSIPGPTGGYKLVRPTADVTVAEVLEAVDGPLAIAQCWEGDGPDACAQARHCHLRGPLARIQDEMTRMLRTTTLAELCATSHGPGEAFPDRSFDPGRVLTVVGRRETAA